MYLGGYIHSDAFALIKNIIYINLKINNKFTVISFFLKKIYFYSTLYYMETIVASKNKNNFIEFLRFVFCFIIVIHHSQNMLPQGSPTFFTSGALSVEFFYIIMGYFAIKHVEEYKGAIKGMTDATKYTVKKLLRLLPYTTIAIVAAYLWEFFIRSYLPLVDRLMSFQNMPSELLMLPMTGQIEISLNAYRCTQLWFLSCMLIALPIVMYLSVKCNDVFKGYLVWFVPFMLLAYMGFKWTSIFAWGAHGAVLYGGTVRAIADLLLGGGAYYTVNAIKNKGFNPGSFLKFIFTLCEIILLAFTVFSCHRSELTVYDQIFVAMIIWLMLVITLSGISYSGTIFSGLLSPLWSFLGKISMPVFCLHWTVFKYLENEAFAGLGYWTKVCINIVVCIIIYLVVSSIGKLIKKKRV